MKPILSVVSAAYSITALGAVFLSAALFLTAPAPSAHAGDTKAVVELFTSQGCSSCPPADQLAAEIMAERDDVLVLSLAVDYWDFLGWTDTLAQSAHSERQRGYAIKRGDKAVYTPQMVINGGPHLVGSDRGRLTNMLDRPTQFGISSLPVDVDLAFTANTLDITVETTNPVTEKMASVWALLVSSEVEVTVRAGENRGRSISYTNVVRGMLPIGVFEGERASLRLPVNDLTGPLHKDTGIDRIAVIVQAEKNGIPSEILGAAIIPTPGAEVAAR